LLALNEVLANEFSSRVRTRFALAVRVFALLAVIDVGVAVGAVEKPQ
jgi:hypothetical protein